MHRLLHLKEAAGPAAVSTGQLPGPIAVAGLVRAAWDRYAPIAEGKVADYIPALAAASPDWFGLCVAGVDGTLHAAGDADRCRRVLAVMATAGLYEQSGDWLYEVGLPGTSGVAGQLATRLLSEQLGLTFFALAPGPA
jgi:glutaminase